MVSNSFELKNKRSFKINQNRIIHWSCWFVGFPLLLLLVAMCLLFFSPTIYSTCGHVESCFF